MLADGVHEVGFSQTDAAIHKERVVGLGRVLGDSQRRRVGKLVVGPHDKGVKRVPGIHPIGRNGSCGGLSRGGGFPCAGGTRGGRFQAGLFRRRLRALQRLADGEVDFAGAAQHFENGRLEQPHVVGLDPELINVIGHPQRNLGFVRLQKLERLEPTLERIGAHLGADGVGNMLPDQGEIFFHK